MPQGIHHLKRARVISQLLDSQFSFLGYRFGIDPLLGLIPGLGDGISLILSFYIFYIALEMQVPKQKLLLMLRNIGFDFVLGVLPVIGDVSDFIYKSNQRNLEILESHMGQHPEEGEVIA